MKIEQQLDIIIEKLDKIVKLLALRYAGDINITITERSINLYKCGFNIGEIAELTGRTKESIQERIDLIKAGK